MVRTEVVRRRLSQLDEYLSILRGLQKYGLEEFLADPEHYGSAERFLQLAIETTIDLGSHVIADLGLGTIEHYNDIPSILAEKGYVEQALRDEWIRMIGFRNVLVHEYLEIDRRIVHDALQNRLETIEALRRLFAQFL